jgi:hypothetical protein
MNLSKYGLLAGMLCVMIFSSLVGGHFGYTVNGVPQTADLSLATPGFLGVVEWVWDSIVFMFNMVTFRVDGMPVFVSAIFVVMSVLVVFLIVSLIRGDS